ncbi:Mobile element protein [Richelia intracellularis]|nr:Mobile element protein [Richelia intracellularis]
MTKNYPSNLTWEQWEQWELIPEMFPEAKPGGRPRTTCIVSTQ